MSECYTEDGQPIKCPGCGHETINEEVVSMVDAYQGQGPVSEAKYICGNCKEVVGYWAYGHFDPAYMD